MLMQMHWQRKLVMERIRGVVDTVLLSLFYNVKGSLVPRLVPLALDGLKNTVKSMLFNKAFFSNPFISANQRACKNDSFYTLFFYVLIWKINL